MTFLRDLEEHLRDLEEHHFWMFWLYVIIACVLILTFGLAGIAFSLIEQTTPKHPVKRVSWLPNYHSVTIADMIATDPANWTRAMHTHITVEGWLTYFAREDDGDIHLRLCDAATVQSVDRKHCIVAEIIPELDAGHPSNHLVLGQKLRVSGNYRYDAEGGCKQAKPSHCWHEVHPVRALEIVQ